MNELSVAFIFISALGFGLGLSILSLLSPWGYDQ